MNLRDHVSALCARHKIEHRTIPLADAARSKCMQSDRCIYAPRVNNSLSYAVALHEIGHFVIFTHRGVLLDEAAVWAWVRENALIWTPQMDALVAKCLTIYAEKIPANDLVDTLFQSP